MEAWYRKVSVTYRHTYRPSDEAGPRGAFAQKIIVFLILKFTKKSLEEISQMKCVTRTY